MDTGVHVPEAEVLHGLAVRPDVLVIAIAARIEDVSPAQAVTILKHTAAKLQTKMLDVHPKSELSARKLDLGRMHSHKSTKGSLADSQLDGVLLVPLDEKLDYWARAELFAKITETLQSFAFEVYKAKPCVYFGSRAPVPRVRNVTAHKTELTKRHAAQWQMLTANSEKSPGPNLWEIPEEVAQYAVSLDEVRLALVPTRKFPSPRES